MPRKSEVEVRDITPPPEVQDVLVEAPMVLDRGGYTARHVEAHLSGSQAIALKALMSGLMRRSATLEGGRVVKSQPDAIRWLAERLYESLGAQESERSDESED